MTIDVASLLALVAGATGVIGLARGCWSMVVETRLAVRSLAKEAQSFDDCVSHRSGYPSLPKSLSRESRPVEAKNVGWVEFCD